MSDNTIEHDGDGLAKRIPLLGRFQDEVVDFGRQLSGTLAEHDFAQGAQDTASRQAVTAFHQVMQMFGEIYGALGEAVGLQGDRLDVVRKIGDTTEAEATDQASSWGKGGHHG